LSILSWWRRVMVYYSSYSLHLSFRLSRWLWTKERVNVKLDVLVISFFKHAIVKDIGYLRYLPWRVHNRDLLHYSDGSLYLLLLITYERIVSQVLSLQWLIDQGWNRKGSWLTTSTHDVSRHWIQVSDCVKNLFYRRHAIIHSSVLMVTQKFITGSCELLYSRDYTLS
jgi:hypothetical protein